MLFLPLMFISACKTELPNPNAPQEEEVYNTREGILAVSIGMRQFYQTGGLEAVINFGGVTGRELKGISTFTNVLELEAGGAGLPTFNGNVLTYWSRMQRLLLMAQKTIENAPNVATITDGTRSGILANAYLFRGIALGNLAQAFEQANISIPASGGGNFVPRLQVMQEAVKSMTAGIDLITATAPSADFNSNVAGADFDLVNILYAYRARYQLYAGDYAGAIASADAVNLTKRSAFKYSTLSINPVFNRVTTTSDFKARDNFGLPAGLFETGDQRYAFYLGASIGSVNGDPLRTLTGFFTSQTSDIPVYQPDEMRLIKAEAILRNNVSLADAVTLINTVRTQTSGDPFGVYPALPPYSGAVSKDALLLEVYRQRCAELFLSGQKWEDSRRFDRPAPPASLTERNRNYYPYPDQERQNNPNTPADPAI